MSTLPIDSARNLCSTHGFAQVIVLTWDGSETGVTTFGVSDHDSAVAAEAGNRIKRWLGWPEAMCRTESAKVARLHERIAELEAQLECVDLDNVPAREAIARHSFVYIPGLWHCRKCDFQLVQKTLHVHTGDVTARDVPGDRCPNCNTVLWRVTYKDAHAEALRRLEAQHDRIAELEAQRVLAEELSEDVLDRFLVGRATEGDQHLVINALMVIRQKPPIDR